MRAGEGRGTGRNAGERSWVWWGMLLKLGITGRGLGGPAERGRPVGNGFERAGRRVGGCCGWWRGRESCRLGLEAVLGQRV